MNVIELKVSRKPVSLSRIAQRIARQMGIDAAGHAAFEPVAQSVVGVVREGAGLLYHVAEFGVALISGLEDVPVKERHGRTYSTPRTNANVIRFPSFRQRAI